MTDNTKPKDLKLVFVPGCFDDFDGSQEELDELISQIQAMVDNGTLLENSFPVDLDDGTWSDEDIEKLSESVSNMITIDNTQRKLH